MKYTVVPALILLLALSANLAAQSTVSLSTGLGRVIKHRETLAFAIPKRSTQVTLRHSYLVSGAAPWHHYWGRPSVAHAYQVVDYGNREVLGSVHALMRGLDLSLYTRGTYQLSAHLYTGIGYITKTFDYIDNPTNNAVGSSLNNATRLGIELTKQLGKRWQIGLTTHLLHTSNGLTSAPNSGINSWGSSLTVGYRYGNPAKRVLAPAPFDTTYRKVVIDLQAHYGRTEHNIANGPKYPHYVLSAGAGYRYHYLMTALLGVDYEYAGRTYAFFFRDFLTKEQALRRAQRMSIWVAHEFAFDHIIIRPQVGFYLDAFHEVGELMYIKMGAFYKLPLFQNQDIRLGIVLKAHEAVADHLSLAIGLRL